MIMETSDVGSNDPLLGKLVLKLLPGIIAQPSDVNPGDLVLAFRIAAVVWEASTNVWLTGRRMAPSHHAIGCCSGSCRYNKIPSNSFITKQRSTNMD